MAALDYCLSSLSNACKTRISPKTPALSPVSSLSFYVNLSYTPFPKGCLSLTNNQKPNLHLPVIRMAYRYAPDSALRKKKARKRGGDPSKKRKVKRKSKRSKKTGKVIHLVSSAKTGFSYAKRKNIGSKDKLEIRKYDPCVKHHVLFKE